jgi:hypothetical protein
VQRWHTVHRFTSFFLDRVFGAFIEVWSWAALAAGCRWCCRDVGSSVLLGRTISCLWLTPWVGGGGCHLSAERSWVFVECADGGLVVGLGRGDVVPSSLCVL